MREFAAFGITDDARNLKDKFKRELKIVQRDVEKGNQSGKEGERSQLYKYCHHIQGEALYTRCHR
jgi:hypothetical protein